MAKLVRCLAVIGALFLSAGLALGQSAVPTSGDCMTSKTPNAIVAACTKVIDDSTSDSVSRADAYLQRGKAHSTLRNDELAIADFSAAIELSPNAASAYFRRGLVYTDIAKYELAIKDFNRAIELQPDVAAGYLERGIANYHLARFDLCIADLSRALELDRELAGDYDLYLYRGRSFQAKSDHKRAIEDLSRAIAIDPRRAVAFGARGDSFRDQSNCGAAISDYDAALRLSSGDIESLVGRADCFTRSGKVDLAISDLSQALKIDPKYARAYFLRALVWSDKKEWSRAVSDYSDGLAISPRDHDALNNRGHAYLVLGDCYKAIEDFAKAIEIEPTLVIAYSNRSLCLAELGELTLALRDIDQVIKLSPTDAIALGRRGLILGEMGELEKGVKSIDDAIALAPSNASLYLWRGLLFADLGSLDKAIENCTKAIELDRRNAWAFNNRGVAFRRQGKLAESLSDFSTAVDLAPTEPIHLVNRSNVHAAMGRPELAVADVDKALSLSPDVALMFRRASLNFARGMYGAVAFDLFGAFQLGLSSVSGAITSLSFLSLATFLLVSSLVFCGHVLLVLGRAVGRQQAGLDWWLVLAWMWFPAFVGLYILYVVVPDDSIAEAIDSFSGYFVFPAILMPIIVPFVRAYWNRASQWRSMIICLFALLALPSAMTLVTPSLTELIANATSRTTLDVSRSLFVPVARTSCTELTERTLGIEAPQLIDDLASLRRSAVPVTMFWVDNIAKAVAFDAPDIFGCSLTPITYNRNSPLIGSVVFVYRVFSVVIIFAVLALPLLTWWRSTLAARRDAIG